MTASRPVAAVEDCFALSGRNYSIMHDPDDSDAAQDWAAGYKFERRQKQ